MTDDAMNTDRVSVLRGRVGREQVLLELVGEVRRFQAGGLGGLDVAFFKRDQSSWW